MPVLIVAVALVCLALGLAMGVLWARDSQRATRRDLDWYRSTFIRETGDSSLFGRYDIFSADGGVTWRNVDDAGGGRLVIKGPAESGLVEYVLLNSGRVNAQNVDVLLRPESIGDSAKPRTRKPTIREKGRK